MVTAEAPRDTGRALRWGRREEAAAQCRAAAAVASTAARAAQVCQGLLGDANVLATARGESSSS